MKLKQHTKLSIIVIVIAAVLLELTTAVQYFTTRQGISKQLTEKAQRDLNGSVRIAKIKQEVENAVATSLPDIKRELAEIDIASLEDLLFKLLVSQRQIVGVSIGFVPGYVPGNILARMDDANNHKDQLGIYIYEEEEDIYNEDSTNIQLQKEIMDFDYTKRLWYSKVINGHHVTKSGMDGYWSEPYEGNINYVLMCSYSRCLHDSLGNAVAVIAADVPLRELSAMATQLIENQHRSILGVIVLHIIGLLVLAFIIHRSVKSIRRLQAATLEKERIASELSVAHDIQQSMIPKTFPGYPDRDDLELFASLTPAREVGGDFYDFILNGNQLYFCIGDVSGKGVPAALLMTVTRSLFRTEAGRVDPGVTSGQAATIVQSMNQTIYDEQSSGYFATMFVGVLNLTTGQLDYCNAGHEAPIIIGKQIVALPVIPNLPVGALPDWEFEGQQATINSDDTLFLYTDGLTEATDEKGRFLTRQRVRELAQQAQGLAPQQVVELMEKHVREHVGKAEQNDDVTLMALKWHNHHLNLKADLAELPRMKDFVLNAAAQAGLSNKEAKRLRLAVEEAVTNVIQYAYNDPSSNNAHPMVTISSYTDSDALSITITDQGAPFDPTKAPMADTNIPADQRPEGGLGILLMHQMSDNLEYSREADCNILTIKKNK
ncbi:MAG: SpoIIE family protein phosphatase [Prevotella sp.]|nr:SpoIIE family protein phosphatase [Prevotella sp.]